MPRLLNASLLAAALMLSTAGVAAAAPDNPTRLAARLIATNNALPAQADGRWVGLASSPATPGATRDDTTGQVVRFPSADQCPPRPGYANGLLPEGGVALVSCAGFQAVLDLEANQLVRLPVQPPYGVIGGLGRQ